MEDFSEFFMFYIAKTLQKSLKIIKIINANNMTLDNIIRLIN